MDLLNDFRNLFARRRKPQGDATLGLHPIVEDDSASASPLANDRRPLRLQPVDRIPPAEILDSVTQLKDRVEEQSALTQRLLDEVRAMPETSQRSEHVLRSIDERLDQTDSRHAKLDATLEELRHTIDQHAAVLGLLQQQSDANGQSANRVTQAVDSLSPALAEISAAGKRINERLVEVAKEASDRHDLLIAALGNRQKLLIATLALSAFAALAALFVAIYLVINFN